MGLIFTQKIQQHTCYLLTKSQPHPPPKSTMSSHVFTITQEIEEKKWIKMNIRVGSVVKEKVVQMEDKTMDGKLRSMDK